MSTFIIFSRNNPKAVIWSSWCIVGRSVSNSFIDLCEHLLHIFSHGAPLGWRAPHVGCSGCARWSYTDKWSCRVTEKWRLTSTCVHSKFKCERSQHHKVGRRSKCIPFKLGFLVNIILHTYCICKPVLAFKEMLFSENSCSPSSIYPTPSLNVSAKEQGYTPPSHLHTHVLNQFPDAYIQRIRVEIEHYSVVYFVFRS